MTDKVDITQRILETRKQTEELKAQLQSLIDTGKNADSRFHSGIVNSIDGTSGGKENLKSSPNKIQIIRSFDVQHSNHTNKAQSSKNIPKVQAGIESNINKKGSPRKIRNYDVEEARQYIKKQREKRLEQLKAQNEEKCRLENQKKKLQELHKKSLELVTKNVQAKRERSKSRDKNIYVRPQENQKTNNTNARQIRSRSVSRERRPQNTAARLSQNNRSRSNTRVSGVGKKASECIEKNQNQPRNPNLLYPPLPDYMQRKNTEEKEKTENDELEMKVKTHSNNLDLGGNNLSSGQRIVSTELETSNKAILPINLFKSPNGNDEKSQPKETGDISKQTLPAKENGLVEQEIDDALLGIKKSQINLISNITIRSAFMNDQNENPHKDIDDKHESITKKANDRSFNNPMNVSKRNSEQFTKETQTQEVKNEFPKWLEEQPAQAYPFNFINTVKRKLQYTINSPKPSIDIGVQSSLMTSTSPNANVEQLKTREQLRELIQESTKSGKHSDIKSFLSHKHLNLDPKSIDHLELIPSAESNNKYSRIRDIDSRTVIKSTDTGSESDTSKNIPEISSESGTSLKKNAESVRKHSRSEVKLSINTDKLDSMKLIPQRINSNVSKLIVTDDGTENIKSKMNENTKSKPGQIISLDKELEIFDKIPTFSVETEYTSDFHSGSELDLSNDDSAKRRESIISFNSPTYNKQLVLLSPEYLKIDPSIKSSSNVSSENDKNIKISSSEASTTSNKSKHSKNIPLTVSTTSNLDVVPENAHSSKEDQNIKEELTTISSSSDPKVTSENSASSKKFTSLHSNFHPSQSINDQLSKSDSSLQFVNTRRGTGNISRRKKPEILPLKAPSVFLLEPTIAQTSQEDNDSRNKLTKNVCLRSNKSGPAVDTNTTNEIHLKFEAEIHLLNDFNESLRQFSAVEKVFETLKTKNEQTSSKILQNQDTQTSVMTKPSTKSTKSIASGGDTDKSFISGISTINYSRGSFVDSSMDDEFKIFENSALKPESNSLMSTKRDTLHANVTNNSSFVRSENLSNFENVHSSNFAGLSLNMFEQLIKDEDARLENLKTILKIREQVLLDRTKGELAWLEIQRKHFKETGQLHEASVIKKKQRGILVNHQKEKHEMQRLKQMQKAASLERKIVLKEQRNLIRQQLSTDNMLKKMKVSTPRDRRLSGPLKVIQNHTESIRSETSISKRSSTDREKEVLSITSHHSVVSKVSEISEVEVSSRDALSEAESIEQQKIMKRTLLMREETLKKRKKAAEELMQWHKKLLEEEKRIAELESTANAMISQTPTASKQLEKYKFKGKQLNQLWYNLTGCEKKKFIEDKIYPMSQMALERFCKSAREYSTKTKKLLRRNSDSEAKIDSSVSESIPEHKDSQTISVKEASDSSMLPKTVPTNDYVSDFDVESLEDIVNNEDIDVVDQSINLLIDNFSKIKEDISARGSNHSKHSDEDIEITEEFSKDSKFEKSESEAEVSVIETNKASKESELKSSSRDDKLEETNDVAGSEIITQKSSRSLEVAEESDLSENNETGKQISSKEILVSDSKVSTEIDEKIEAEQDVEESIQLTEKDSADLDSPKSVKSKLLTETSETITQPSAISSEVKDTLDESKEILLMLGGIEMNNFVDLSDEGKITDSLSASADILSKLSQVITDPSQEKKSDIETNSDLQDSKHDEFVKMSRDLESKNVSEETLSVDKIGDVSSESLELLMKISESKEKIQSEEGSASLLHTTSNDVLLDISVSEDVNGESDKSVDKISENESVPGEVIDENSAGSSKAVTPELKQSSLHSEKPLETTDIHDEADENAVTADVVSGLDVSNHEITKISDEDILTNKTSEVPNLNIPVNEVVSPSTDVDSPTEAKSVIEEIQTSPSNSEGTSDKSISNLSYGIIEAARSSEADNVDKSVDEKESEPVTTKEDINSFEEKELDSLSSSTNSGSPIEKVDSDEKSTISSEEGEPPAFKTKDVRKRVSEIMAEANQTSKGDKSPRMQDIYVTTYDLISPASSPESLSPISKETSYLPSTSIFGSEAEELLKKQLAIEQEIKAITDQQKKEQQIPLLFVREIPNKPPPPYTPPSSLPTGNAVTIIPTPGEIEEIAKYSAKILYKAHMLKNLENICISENTLSLISKDITKECYKFVFDLCKEIAKEHYQQFEEEKEPAWLCSNKKNKLAVVKPLDVNGLESYMIKKLRELFVYEKPIRRENTIIKWSRKKRDHVDEILVMESQAEEAKWTNYDKDELLVISRVTDEIMNSLLEETGKVLNDIFLRHT